MFKGGEYVMADQNKDNLYVINEVGDLDTDCKKLTDEEKKKVDEMKRRQQTQGRN